MKPEKVTVACPKCGHAQQEPALAYSTNCKQCRTHFRLEEVLHPSAKPVNHNVGHKQVACFKCGTELEVPLSALSTMCKRCGSHVDLRDYYIANAVSKNFKTKGRFVIEPGGFLFNTDSIAGDAVVKGRLLGQLKAERSLEIYSSADIKGRFEAAKLIVPVGERFRWAETIKVGAADIGGELAANVCAQGLVMLRAAARFFGNIEAQNLIVEEGAVVVGNMRVGGGAGAVGLTPASAESGS